jgi:hypothetical protein
VGAGDKLQQRAEGSRGGRTDDVQAVDRGFQAFAKAGVAIPLPDGRQEARIKEVIPGNIDTITGAEQNMIDDPLASVV